MQRWRLQPQRRTITSHTSVLLFLQATPAQLAAERKVAELHGKLHSYESKISQLTEEMKKLKGQDGAVLGPVRNCWKFGPF